MFGLLPETSTVASGMSSAEEWYMRGMPLSALMLMNRLPMSFLVSYRQGWVTGLVAYVWSRPWKPTPAPFKMAMVSSRRRTASGMTL